MIRLGRRRELEDDLRMYRNLLALMPFCVHVRKIAVTPPPPVAASSVVLFRPRRRYPGRHVDWS